MKAPACVLTARTQRREGSRRTVNYLSIILLIASTASGQSATTSLSGKIDPEKKYVFYLHGRIVQEQGAQAVSPRYGAYEYNRIVDTLQSYGYIVISEVRPKGTEMESYAVKIASQIDSLLRGGISPQNITVAGASMGAGIAIMVALKVKNGNVGYVVMGLCDEDTFTYFSQNNLVLCGDFLSVYEASDDFGSCRNLFVRNPCNAGFSEVQLNMGNGHGFIYRPYSEWVRPVVEWIKNRK